VTPEPAELHVRGHDGLDIAVWDYGGDGPPLVLTHCTGTSARSWDPIVDGLRARFHCYAPDARGHGHSEKPADVAAYRWSMPALDLLAVLDTLGLHEGVGVLGHSAGAVHAILAEVHRPGAFTRGLLLDPVAFPDQERDPDAGRTQIGEEARAESTRHRRRVFADRDAARQRYAVKPPMNAWHPDMLDAYLRHAFRTRPDGQVELLCPPEIEAAVYDWATEHRAFYRLHQVGFPALLVTGTASSLGPIVPQQAGRFPDARLRRLHAVGHFIPQEAPGVVRDMAVEWFGA
jgi:pimeloyl-ACP methyl ester carboxylesterase